MISFAKLGAYAAWIAVAVAAAAARPAAADPDTVTGAFDQRSETFNEAWSFADGDGTPPAPAEGPVDGPVEDGDAGGSIEAPAGPTAIAAADDAVMLVGTWAWQGSLEGMPAYIETAFYPDGTYESVAQTPVLQLYEAGYWALVDGMLSTEVVDYAPRVIQTPYGPQAIPVEVQQATALAFVDEDTVETEIGLSYRVD